MQPITPCSTIAASDYLHLQDRPWLQGNLTSVCEAWANPALFCVPAAPGVTYRCWRGGFAIPMSTSTECSWKPWRPFASVLWASSRSLCSWRWDTPTARGKWALASGTTNHPALGRGVGTTCCSRGACSGCRHCTLPIYCSKALEPVVHTGFSRHVAPIKGPFKRFAQWLEDRFKNHPTNQKESFCPMQKPAGRAAPSPGCWHIPWHELRTSWPTPVPVASAFLSLQPNFCACQTLLSLGALMQSAAIWLE